MDFFHTIFELYSTRSAYFLELFIQHLQLSITAAVIAAVIGLTAGICISGTKVQQPVIAVANAIYTIPSISLLGFLIPFSGIGATTAIIALIIYGIMPVLRNTCTGLTTVNKAVIEAARGMGSTDLQILLRIKLPLASPAIIAGLRNMTVMTISLSGVSAFIGAGGLGAAVYRGITTNNAAFTVAGSLLIAITAITADCLFGLIENYLTHKWRLIK